MKHIQSILVVGGGTAGWMAASYFSKLGFAVTLVESPNVPTIGVGESCMPSLSAFCEQLGLDDAAWMPESNAVYKLGIYHYNWMRPGSLWKHWFQYDRTRSDSEWMLENARLPGTREDRRYSYHIDATAFGQMLRTRVALPLGVQHIQAHIAQVQQHEDGHISGLVLDSGQTVASDFYIDCSGTAQLLSRKVGIQFEQYGDIPNDRAIACPQELEALGAPNYTITYAARAGWLWNTALTHRRGCGYTYSSAFATDEQALAEYLTYYPNTDQTRLRFLKFDSQYAVNPLEKNVLAVGLSSGFIEPLEATSIFLIQYYIETFARVINTERDPRVYNRTVHRTTRELYEFVLTSYTLSQRRDTDYWQYYQDLETKLNTRDLVLERARQPDVPYGAGGLRIFYPCNWWSKARHYELL